MSDHDMADQADQKILDADPKYELVRRLMVRAEEMQKDIDQLMVLVEEAARANQETK